jgi:hypothetical protein
MAMVSMMVTVAVAVMVRVRVRVLEREPVVVVEEEVLEEQAVVVLPADSCRFCRRSAQQSESGLRHLCRPLPQWRPPRPRPVPAATGSCRRSW